MTSDPLKFQILPVHDLPFACVHNFQLWYFRIESKIKVSVVVDEKNEEFNLKQRFVPLQFKMQKVTC